MKPEFKNVVQIGCFYGKPIYLDAALTKSEAKFIIQKFARAVSPTCVTEMQITEMALKSIDAFRDDPLISNNKING